MKKREKSGFYPILINLNRFNCLVVGGGNVAYRKVISLLDFNAKITVVSPRICKPLISLYNGKQINVIRKNYSKEFLKDFKFVFCATNNRGINEAVREDCTIAGILLNAADNPPLCDFILPANVKRGNLTISISSQGKAPFFTKVMKDKIDHSIPDIYSDIINLAGEFREKVLKNKKVKSSKTKAKVFRHFSARDWEQILSKNGTKSSKHYIQEILKEFNLI